jgi:DNA replication protein DnaC
MMTYFLKKKYPSFDFDTSYDCWKEEHEFECKTHGKQIVRLDYGMVCEGEGSTNKQLEEAYCPICKQEEEERIKVEQDKIALEKRLLECREIKKATLRRNMQIPPRFADASFDNFTAKTPTQKAALKACKTFAENFKAIGREKGGLLMMGTVGTGKTHLSVAIGLHLLSQDLEVKYTTIGRLIRKVRSTWSDKEATEEGVYDSMACYKLLIIDEIGVQNCTENEKNILFEVINARYEEQRPTILVSNLNPQDLTATVGQRIMDRISEGGGNRIVFDWDSHRQKAA